MRSKKIITQKRCYIFLCSSAFARTSPRYNQKFSVSERAATETLKAFFVPLYTTKSRTNKRQTKEGGHRRHTQKRRSGDTYNVITKYAIPPEKNFVIVPPLVFRAQCVYIRETAEAEAAPRKKGGRDEGIERMLPKPTGERGGGGCVIGGPLLFFLSLSSFLLSLAAALRGRGSRGVSAGVWKWVLEVPRQPLIRRI